MRTYLKNVDILREEQEQEQEQEKKRGGKAMWKSRAILHREAERDGGRKKERKKGGQNE